jgi:hypothetical protein
MRKSFNWQLFIAFIFLLCSFLFYCLHYFLFHDLHHIFLYLVGDIAFLFINVLLTTFVLQKLMDFRDKRIITKKLNTVIGVFFNEVGTELIRKCAKFDGKLAQISTSLVVTKDWSDGEFDSMHKSVAKHVPAVDSRKGSLIPLRDFLLSKRQFMLNLLENPNLLEHEAFTELTWAVFHLTDELGARVDFASLPESDYNHLSIDIKRAYSALILQWLDYMKYLKHDYPYLFSLAMRTNPFDEQANVVVRG